METAEESPRSNNKRRMYLSLAVISTLIVIIGGTGVWLLHTINSQGIPSELVAAKSTVPYTLYYPNQLPKGVSYSASSLKATKDVTIYSLSLEGKKIFVSITPKPKDVVFDDFYSRVLTNKADVFSTAGKAAMGTANDQMVGSLVTGNAWVLINAPLSTDDQIIQSLLSSLAPVVSK